MAEMATLFERLAKSRPPAPAETVRNDPTAQLLEWIVRHWNRPEISLRDIHRSGPTFLRDKKTILNLAQELAERGWLTPAKSHRHDRRIWKIARGLPLGNHTN
jgi:hypothetical protein